MRKIALLVAGAIVLATLVTPTPASSSGGMRIPSTGTIGSTGYFLSCRSTTSSTSSTQYYDQQNTLRTWDCGAGMRPHKGVDILGPSTTPGVNPVYAAASGEVWTAERGNGFGWRVVLRHGQVGGNGRFTYTIYGHMGNCSTGASFIAPGMVPGAAVAAGQLVGYQGDDGYPDGCASRTHVHFEIRASDADVDNVFNAIPASPDFYTGVPLTADDPVLAASVTAGGGTVPTVPPPGSPTPRATGSPGPASTPIWHFTWTPRPRPTLSAPPWWTSRSPRPLPTFAPSGNYEHFRTPAPSPNP